jgi:site-specific DNA recombinase
MASTAAIYCRISEDRTGEGLGVARQEQDCRGWAERHGWDVAEVYVDDDISAYKGKPRPAYRRLLEAIKSGERDGLIAWHPDRLHRSPRELEDFIDLLETTGIPVGTVTAGDIDLSSASGKMVARIVGSVARHESDHKSERIRRKHRELAENGKVPGGGIRPFGYELDRKTIRDDEADLIREAARRVLAGDGVRTVANDWNARGICTVTGVPWSPTTIKRLLMSGRIAGLREHHGNRTDAEWAPIIDHAMSDDLRRILQDPARNLSGGANPHKYLLSGMLRCGVCGATLTARPVRRKGIRYRRYACVADRGGCNRCGIGAGPVEELIVEAVMIRLDTPALSKATAQREANPVQVDIDDLEGRLRDLASMFANREITKEEWLIARTRLSEQLAHARQTEAAAVRDSAVADQLARPDVLRTEWPQMSLERQRTVLAAIIDRIVIAPTTKAGNKFNPDRIDVIWKH